MPRQGSGQNYGHTDGYGQTQPYGHTQTYGQSSSGNQAFQTHTPQGGHSPHGGQNPYPGYKQQASNQQTPPASQGQIYYPDGTLGDPNKPPEYLNPRAKYDTEPPVMASKHRQSWYDWFTGKPPVLTSPAELRDERYVSYVMSMHKVFLDYEHQQLTNEQALYHVEFYLAKIREIGHVDDERTTAMLEQQGFTYQERADMQREYEDLKQRCGQKVPRFKQNMNPVTDTQQQQQQQPGQPGQQRRSQKACF